MSTDIPKVKEGFEWARGNVRATDRYQLSCGTDTPICESDIGQPTGGPRKSLFDKWIGYIRPISLDSLPHSRV